MRRRRLAEPGLASRASIPQDAGDTARLRQPAQIESGSAGDQKIDDGDVGWILLEDGPSVVEVERHLDGVSLGPQEIFGVVRGKGIPFGDEDPHRLVFARPGLNGIAASLLEKPVRIRRLHAAIEFFEDESQLVDLFAGVETVPAALLSGTTWW